MGSVFKFIRCSQHGGSLEEIFIFCLGRFPFAFIEKVFKNKKKMLMKELNFFFTSVLVKIMGCVQVY
jgi:hypothetical protein